MPLFDDEPGIGLANQKQEQPLINPLMAIGMALQGFSSGMQGRSNPSLEYVQGQMALRQRQQELDRRKEQDRLDKVDKGVSLLLKSGIDDESARKVLSTWVDSDPDLKTAFGDIVKDVGFSGGKLILKRVFNEGELKDPLSGKPLPKGEYEVEWGKGIKSGPTSIKAVSEKDTDPFGKINPKDFTPESIKAFQESGGKDRSLLIPVEGKSPSVGGDREAFAKQLYNKPYGELDQAQMAQVNNRVKQYKLETAPPIVVQTGPTTEIIPRTQAQGGISLKEGLTPEQDRRARGEIADLENTQALVDELKGLADNIITAEGAASANIQGLQLEAGSLTRMNETAALYADKKSAFTGVISRSLGGERGVLTDRDIDRITRALPSFRDTKRMKDFKISSIQRILDTAANAKRAALENKPFDRQGFRKKLDNMLSSMEGGPREVTTADDFLKKKGLKK